MRAYEDWMKYRKENNYKSELVDDAPQWAVEEREKFLERLEKEDELTDY